MELSTPASISFSIFFFVSRLILPRDLSILLIIILYLYLLDFLQEHVTKSNQFNTYMNGRGNQNVTKSKVTKPNQFNMGLYET